MSLTTYSIDGFEVPNWVAEAALQSGSAIPRSIAHLQTQPGFQFNSHGLGIFTFQVETSYTSPATSLHWDDDGNELPPTWSEDGMVNVDLHTQTFYIPTNWNPVRQTKDYVPLPPKDKITDRLNAEQNKCRNFLNDVLKKLGNKGDLTDIDNIIKRIVSIDLQPNLIGTTKAGQAVFKNGKRAIDVRPPIGVAGSALNNDQLKFYQDNYISAIFHELLHHAFPREDGMTIYGHKEIAKAVNNSIDSKTNGEIENKLGKKFKKIRGSDALSSNYLNEALNIYCPGG